MRAKEKVEDYTMPAINLKSPQGKAFQDFYDQTYQQKKISIPFKKLPLGKHGGLQHFM